MVVVNDCEYGYSSDVVDLVLVVINDISGKMSNSGVLLGKLFYGECELGLSNKRKIEPTNNPSIEPTIYPTLLPTINPSNTPTNILRLSDYTNNENKMDSNDPSSRD
eukprot:22109_1